MVKRTVMSIMKDEALHLIHEIILVDDASTEKGMSDLLEDYIEQWDGVVKKSLNNN